MALAVSVYALAAGQSGLRRFGWLAQLVVLVAGLLLGWGSTGWRSVVFARTALAPVLEGQNLQVTGVVEGLPQTSEVGTRFTLRVEHALLDGKPVSVPPRIGVGWYANRYARLPEADDLPRAPAALQAGERWQLTLRAKAPHGSMNPHGFDFELWLWEQGVQATAYVRDGPNDPPPHQLGQTWYSPLAWARQTLRDRIMQTVPNPRAAGLLAALVVGDQSAVERSDWEVFRTTDVAHLVSISGLHITMFAWGAALLVGGLWRRSGRLCLWLPAANAALVGGVVFACGYSVLAGWGVPAQRTCMMLATVALLRLCGAHWPWPQVWMLACAVVVAVDPWALLQAGFWLSFVAVGVLFATDSGAKNGAHKSIRSWIFLKFGGLLREQWLITLALAPLSVLLFGQLSVVGLVANLLAIPWVTLVLTPLALLGVVLPIAWVLAAQAADVLWWWLSTLADWPWAAWSWPVPPLGWGVLAVLGGVLVALPVPWHLRALGLPMVLPVLLWRPVAPAPGEFALLAADIGQGNAVLVRTAHHTLLFDTGPRYSEENDAGQRVLVPLLKAQGLQLDTVVLSHRDMDHVGGAAAVLQAHPKAALLSSVEPTHPLQQLRAAQRCEAGQQWAWDGVQFAFLHPQTQDYVAGAKPNALSCVLRISNGRRTALLAGDIEAAQEARLVHDWQGSDHLQADVLLVPHHGSKTSSSAAFLHAVSPRWAWVQAGYRNHFGHPATLVVERYKALGIDLVRSPQCGAMAWRSDEPQNVACTRVQEGRYWHHLVP